MKKLIVLLFIFVSFLKPSFAQPDSIKVIPTGLSETKFKVNSNAITIYNRTLSWINETYQNPDKVITGKVEGKSVNISGYLKNAYHVNPLGMSMWYDVSYHIYIIINDSIVNYNIIIDNIIADGKIASYNTSTQYQSWFKSNGDPRQAGMYSKPRLEFQENINKLLFSYYDKFKNMEITSDEAISLLKKYKDKLDLQLITQDEYNQKKTELLKYIK